MNIKYIVIVGIFFLTLTCVSAAENSTDIVDVAEIDEIGNVDDIEEIGDVNDVNINDINVTFTEQVWEENLSDINVELPESANGTFAVKIGNEIIYNQTITNKSFKVPIKLPKDLSLIIVNLWPPLDSKTYQVNAFYNDIDLNLNRTLTVMRYPQNFTFMWNFPEEILPYSEHSNRILFPRSANGEVELYLDERFLTRKNVTNPLFEVDLPVLELGNHTLKVVYLGDKYYLPANKTLNFTVVNAVISVPHTVNIGHDDCISVDVLKTTNAKVEVFLDSKLIHTENVKGDEFILSLADYLKFNSSEVTVTVTSNNFTRTKTVPINITFDFEVYITRFTYGEDDALEITLPDNLNNKLFTVEIDGVKQSFIRPSYIMNNIVEVDVSKLGAGNHTLFMYYPGDDKFISKNKTVNFTVDYSIQGPFAVEFRHDSIVYLKLPENANGNLTVYLNGVLFKTVKLTKGYAQINLNSLTPDEYDMNASYTGSDYNVSNYYQTFDGEPEVVVDYRFTVGEDKHVRIYVPKDTKGYVIINNKNITIKNGVAEYSLKNFKPGTYDINIDYYGQNGFTFKDYRVITVYKPKLKIISSKLYVTKLDAKIKVLNHNNKALANVKVKVNFNGKNFIFRTNKNGILTIKKSVNLKVKKYTLTVKYNGAEASKKLKAKNVLKVKKIRKSNNIFLKATLREGKTPLKNKIVTFKVNKKTIKIKTNKKGDALLKIDNSKKNTYKVTYLKQTIKA